MRRQIFLKRLRQFVRDMSEVRFFRLNARCHLDCLGHAEMSRMRFLSQRIDDQTFDPEDVLRDIIRYCAAIAEICNQIAPGSGKQVAIHLRRAVRHW